MSELLRDTDLVTAKEYLDGEKVATGKHEYVNGRVYAMSGAGGQHGLVSMNLAAALHGHLRGGPCNVFSADMKVHVKTEDDERFYYPDLVVSCDDPDQSSHFRDHPKVVVEILSDSTWRTDWNEKLPAFQAIPSMEEIVFIAPRWCEIHVFRKSKNWERETLTEIDATLRIKSLDFQISATQLYEGITFPTLKRPWYLANQ